MALVNIEVNKNFKTRNKTIMDLVHKYIKVGKLSENLHTVLNQVRLFKKMNLPCELVGLLGNKETEACRNEEACSMFEWSIAHLKVPRSSRKSFDCWSKFVNWLKQQRIFTVCDFEESAKSRFSISINKQYAKENKEGQIKFYEKIKDRYGKLRYGEINNNIDAE